jgi:hypothetical protein
MRGRIALPKLRENGKALPWISREALLECDASSRRFNEGNCSLTNGKRLNPPNWKFRYGMRAILEEIHEAVAK